jgi:glycosyltransferase involved in cell wall biosynthesis
MKLLIYSHFFAPSIGGVETFAMLLASGLSRLHSTEASGEIRVTVVTQTPASNFDDSKLSFPIVRQPSTARLRQLIRQADVVHIDGPALAPLFWARVAGKPVLVEHHVYQAICLNGLLIHQPDRSVCPGHFQAKNFRECVKCRSVDISPPRAFVDLIKGLLRNMLVRGVAKNIAITDHVLHRINLPNSSRIYYGISDPIKTEIAEPRATTGKVCFAFVGRFVAEKGIPILLQASSLLAQENLNFEVRLIGDGRLRPQLEQIIAEKNLQNHVRITGYLSGAALAHELSDVSVVVMPSLWEETAGLSAIEQMMTGRLVIASNIGGLGEVVGDAGLCCASGDLFDLAGCMRAVILDPSLIDSIGKKARARALQLFQEERMIADHAKLYLAQAARTSADRNSKRQVT